MAIVRFEKTRYTVDTMYQWDKNQILKIYGLSLASMPEVHFANAGMDRAVVGQASMDDLGVITANVPNSFLQKSLPIYVYIGVYEGESFKTLYTIVIPIKGRQKPNDYTIEDDNEIYSFNYLENKFNNSVGEAMTAYQNAAAQHLATVEQITDLMANQTAEFNEAMEQIDYALSGGATDDIKTKFEGFDAHVESEENPHGVTRQQLGIGCDFGSERLLGEGYEHIFNDNVPIAVIATISRYTEDEEPVESQTAVVVNDGGATEFIINSMKFTLNYRLTDGVYKFTVNTPTFDFTRIGIYLSFVAIY